jgi:hypothetical protein
VNGPSLKYVVLKADVQKDGLVFDNLADATERANAMARENGNTGSTIFVSFRTHTLPVEVKQHF